MKILVAVKRVTDPDLKIKVLADGSGIDLENMKYVVNPFDEIAVEEAIRLRDSHKGEVVIWSLGPKDGIQQIRTALAMGGDRGIHVVTDDEVDSLVVAKALKKAVEEEQPDIVMLGKLSVDAEAWAAGPMLAEMLGWPQATFAAKEANLESEEEKARKPGIIIENERAKVVREVDGGLEVIEVPLPAVLTADLRLNQPRYASLPGIMKAKRKKVEEKTLADLGVDGTPALKILKLEPPAERQAGMIVPDVVTLMDKLRNEAKVI